MLFEWFNATASKEFGAALAKFYIERIPIVASIEKDKKFASKTKAAMDKMSERVDQFKTSHRLNTYQKAQLGNAFKWSLREAGYDKAYIDRLTEWLVTRI